MINEKIEQMIIRNKKVEYDKSIVNIFLNEFIEIVKNEKIIIYGLGGAGLHLKKILEELNINISACVDKNAHELNKYYTFDIKKPEYLLNIKNHTIFIAGNPSTSNDIYHDISYDIKKENNVIKAFLLLSLLAYADCWLNIKRENRIKYSLCANCDNGLYGCKVQSKYINRQEGDGKAQFGLIGIITGQICTLKCKHCCEAVPFIQHPLVYNTKEIINDIAILSKTCKYINRVEFVGGEPFLNKDLPKIINEVLKFKNIGFVVVFTNGTVLPNDELIKVLQHNRVTVVLSDYSKQIDAKKQIITKKVLHILKKNSIDILYHNTYGRTWFDILHWEKRNINLIEQKSIFKDCFIGNCTRLFKGKLYHCPHYYAGVQLGKVENFHDSCIDLHAYDNIQLIELLDKFITNEALEACKYCNMPYNAEAYSAAIQISKDLEGDK